MFHGKHFCPIGDGHLTTAHTSGRLEMGGIARKVSTLGDWLAGRDVAADKVDTT